MGVYCKIGMTGWAFRSSVNRTGKDDAGRGREGRGRDLGCWELTWEEGLPGKEGGPFKRGRNGEDSFWAVSAWFVDYRRNWVWLCGRADRKMLTPFRAPCALLVHKL